MDMNKISKITKFTLIQQLKAKSFKISTIIILAAVIILTSLINIIPAFKSKEDSSDQNQGVKKEIAIEGAYIVNESDLEVTLKDSIKGVYPDLKVKESDKSSQELIKDLENTVEKEVLLLLSKEDNGYRVRVVTPKESEKSLRDDAHELVTVAQSLVESERLANSGVAPEKLQQVSMPIYSDVQQAGEKEESMEDMMFNMIFPMIACILLFYIIYFYGYWVANSIVAEKTSRVMELLLTSTRPLELVVGKCIAMGTLAVTQFLSIILAAFLGFQGGGFIAKEFINPSVKLFDIGIIFEKITFTNLVIIILFFVFGYALYAVFNALVGATVSKLEDLNTAMMPVTFLSLIGFYVAYMAMMGEGTIIAKIATFLPFSSPFYIPATLFTGTIPMSHMIISLIILIASVILIVLFTARVYSVVILHTGNRLKFKDLFSIYNIEK